MLLFKLKLCLLESSFAVHNMPTFKKKKGIQINASNFCNRS